ncbi:MAG: S-layer family protein [Scytonematopsis contorta HA4267-MV1]|nr:S-layer family protein [Scytonematopsis contorta HA4267-MV1]
MAQITPDASLGVESSVVKPDVIKGVPSERIDSGAIRGTNLFHSFGEFNIQEGRGAYFSHPDSITNIFSRVTGKNLSNILGTLGVLGNANLFFINPSGIVFGPNSKLDLRGSFLASSSSSIVFNGFEFSAVNPQAPPLLTVNIPLGLRFRENPGTIINQSRSSRVIQDAQTPVGLEVTPGQTLALLGGDLNLDSGNITAFGGNILLGSIASPGFIGFNLIPTSSELDYRGVENFGNIDLSGTASVIASGTGGGAINIRAGKLTLSERANIASNTLGNIDGRDINILASQIKLQDGAFIHAATLGTGKGGNIAVRATDSLELRGISYETYQRNYVLPAFSGTVNLSNLISSILVGSFGLGDSGKLTVSTQQLKLSSGAYIGGPTQGTGRGGNTHIQAGSSIEVDGGHIQATAGVQGGNAGNLTIDTGNLLVQGLGTVSTATIGSGKGGNLTINAKDSVVVSGRFPNALFVSSINTLAASGTGDAGNMEINAGSVVVKEGGSINAGSGFFADRLYPSLGRGGNLTINARELVNVAGLGFIGSVATSGNAVSGDVRINTKRLLVENEGTVGASTLGAGKSGNVIINASETVEIRGTSGSGGLGIGTTSGDLYFQAIYQLPPATGIAGDLSITTNRLIVEDKGKVSVESLGSGNAGKIEVAAKEIFLNNQGKIDGRTVSGEGANINLQAQYTILRRGSQITTDAGTSNGGNISLKGDVLVAFPQENSDITANARTAKGGSVTINFPNIFGFAPVSREQVRERLGLTDTELEASQVSPTQLLTTSNIAAISQASGPNLQGTVTFSTSGVNPAQGLVELPENILDPASLIATNPCLEGGASEFVIAGRGGLPVNPGENLGDDGVRVSWSDLPISPKRSERIDNAVYSNYLSPPVIIPARGWIFNQNGDVTLVGYNTGEVTQQRSSKPSSSCYSP